MRGIKVTNLILPRSVTIGLITFRELDDRISKQYIAYIHIGKQMNIIPFPAVS